MEENAVSAIGRLFHDHPASVDETYFEHMRFAAWFSSRLLMAGGAALAHAVFPFLFETTASGIIRQLHARIEGRGATPGEHVVLATAE